MVCKSFRSSLGRMAWNGSRSLFYSLSEGDSGYQAESIQFGHTRLAAGRCSSWPKPTWETSACRPSRADNSYSPSVKPFGRRSAVPPLVLVYGLVQSLTRLAVLGLPLGLGTVDQVVDGMATLWVDGHQTVGQVGMFGQLNHRVPSFPFAPFRTGRPRRSFLFRIQGSRSPHHCPRRCLFLLHPPSLKVARVDDPSPGRDVMTLDLVDRSERSDVSENRIRGQDDQQDEEERTEPPSRQGDADRHVANSAHGHSSMSIVFASDGQRCSTSEVTNTRFAKSRETLEILVLSGVRADCLTRGRDTAENDRSPFKPFSSESPAGPPAFGPPPAIDHEPSAWCASGENSGSAAGPLEQSYLSMGPTDAKGRNSAVNA